MQERTWDEVRDDVRDAARRIGAEHEARARELADPDLPLSRAALAELGAAGFTRVAAPASHGGLWTTRAEGVARSIELVRIVAREHASLGLVVAMHPSVAATFLLAVEAPEPQRAAFEAQLDRFHTAAAEGAFWATMTSEPGSGGALRPSNTRAVADTDGSWRITGTKHFCTGFGMLDLALLHAVPEGETDPDWFILDVSDVPAAGNESFAIKYPWSSRGMRATASHPVELRAARAERIAWTGELDAIRGVASPLSAASFMAAAIGVADAALDDSLARHATRPGGGFARRELVDARQDALLLDALLAHLVTAIGAGDPEAGDLALRGKHAAAEIVERLLARLAHAAGGSGYARNARLGDQFDDVRALGFLRPPWDIGWERLQGALDHAADAAAGRRADAR
jgi:alkylation response protein AidB-like acyl-CoA dehydrogenase